MKVVEATQQTVPIYQEFVGQILGAVDIEIRARVSGWLQGFILRKGPRSKKGPCCIP